MVVPEEERGGVLSVKLKWVPIKKVGNGWKKSLQTLYFSAKSILTGFPMFEVSMNNIENRGTIRSKSKRNWVKIFF